MAGDPRVQEILDRALADIAGARSMNEIEQVRVRELPGEAFEDARRAVLVDHPTAPRRDRGVAELGQIGNAGHLLAGSRAEVETHFRATHLPNIISRVESHSLTGTVARNLRSQGLARSWSTSIPLTGFANWNTL